MNSNEKVTYAQKDRNKKLSKNYDSKTDFESEAARGRQAEKSQSKKKIKVTPIKNKEETKQS